MAISLVTGGAGFIGSHIARELLARGDRVRILDNFSTGKRQNLAGMEADIELIQGDIRNLAVVEQATRDVEYIFHHAAMVSVPLSVENPQECFDVNVQGTVNLLERARHAGVSRLVLASSAAVYGESQAYPLNESGETMSYSPYAASKRVNEIYADLYTRTTDMGVTALRYFNVYGPRQSPDSHYAAAIPIFIRLMLDGKQPVIYGDGLQSRDFVFVGDVVRANLTAAASPAAAGKVLNICTGQEISVLDLVTTLGKLIPDALEPVFDAPRPGDVYRSVGDNTSAQTIMNFIPQTDLMAGLEQTVAWMGA
ncbi:MAG: SDR family NAD(P)-dependent oxidoreductase [Chloroflexi bacterium]|jgi:UDP-glucose 4-epimerase|nr:SDR family NAD(P)-dependent oxidoreductase [Chloroflexota bacterium]